MAGSEAADRNERLAAAHRRAAGRGHHPGHIGDRSQLVLDGIGPNGHRKMSYRIRPQVRGRFSAGLLRVRMADAFGLVEISRSFSTTSTLVVTPRIFPLPRPLRPAADSARATARCGRSRPSARTTAAPRAYQDGNELHRVHWKSTARYDELIVRREEHQWHNSASVFLDTRRVPWRNHTNLVRAAHTGLCDAVS
jgi:uncharacterized protein (DUF58 family)